jgi:hypothetical protein
LQLNITSNPFFFLASFRETSFPEISFSFRSAFGMLAPMGNTLLNVVNAKDKVATAINAKTIFFMI